jgi:hypothetical protein
MEPKNITGGINNTPLKLFDLRNIITILSFYSPIILVSSIVGLSFIFQNFKGFIYLGFLLGVCIIRNYAYMMNGAKPIENEDNLCSSVQYSKYGNATFSIFVFAFTIMYISLPMFSNGYPNLWVFIGLLFYFFVDIIIKTYNKCIVNIGDLVINTLVGLFSAAVIITLMYSGGSGKYLFFNEIQSDAKKCSMPSKQTFKCALYKNGELISGTTV